MINTSTFNKSNASDEDICQCASQADESDYILCRICTNHPRCTGLALKKLSQILIDNRDGDCIES